MSYKVVFKLLIRGKAEIIYDDRSLTIETIPLRHRIPTCGFLFSEKQTPAHIRRDMIDFYEIPVYELNRIKNGADYITGRKNSTKQQIDYPFCPPPPICLLFRYYLFAPRIIEQIYGVDLLFHEATFAQSEQARAKETFHATASQAGEIARTAKVKQLLIGHFSARYEDEAYWYRKASDIFLTSTCGKH